MNIQVPTLCMGSALMLALVTCFEWWPDNIVFFIAAAEPSGLTCLGFLQPKKFALPHAEQKTHPSTAAPSQLVPLPNVLELC